jgi:hypothetical protein
LRALHVDLGQQAERRIHAQCDTFFTRLNAKQTFSEETMIGGLGGGGGLAGISQLLSQLASSGAEGGGKKKKCKKKGGGGGNQQALQAVADMLQQQVQKMQMGQAYKAGMQKGMMAGRMGMGMPGMGMPGMGMGMRGMMQQQMAMQGSVNAFNSFAQMNMGAGGMGSSGFFAQSFQGFAAPNGLYGGVTAGFSVTAMQRGLVW